MGRNSAAAAELRAAVGVSRGRCSPPPSYRYADHKAIYMPALSPHGLPPRQKASFTAVFKVIFGCIGFVPTVMGLLWLLCFISALET